MKTKQNVTLLALTALILIGLAACEPKNTVKVDKKKSLDTIKQEASQMDTAQLRQKVMQFKNAITARAGEVTNIMESINTNNTGDTKKGIKLNDNTNIDEFMQTISDLKKRYDIYFTALKQKNGDLTGLSLGD